MTDKQQEAQALHADITRFLRNGGRIEKLPAQDVDVSHTIRAAMETGRRSDFRVSKRRKK